MDVEERTTTAGKIIDTLNITVQLSPVFGIFFIWTGIGPWLLPIVCISFGPAWEILISSKIEDYVDKRYRWPKDVTKIVRMGDVTVTLDIQKSQDLTLRKVKREVVNAKKGVWRMDVERTSVLDLDLEPDACDVIINSGKVEEITKTLVKMADSGSINGDDTITATDVKAMMAVITE